MLSFWQARRFIVANSEKISTGKAGYETLHKNAVRSYEQPFCGKNVEKVKISENTRADELPEI